MEFPLIRREPVEHHYDKDVMETAYEFTKQLQKELGTIVRAVVLFGSAAKPSVEDPHDIDLLIIIDDIEVAFTKELQQAYRVIVENLVRATSTRLHISTLRFSNFWEFVRVADPVIVSVLRDGRALIDTGFFTPMQLLLMQGRIRPSTEAIWSYYTRSPQLLLASKYKLMLGVVDLYWAVINSAHAALMASGVVPESPEHVPRLLRETLVSNGVLEAGDADTVEKFYQLQKDIYSRRIETLSGARYEALFAEADSFVKKMHELLA